MKRSSSQSRLPVRGSISNRESLKDTSSRAHGSLSRARSMDRLAVPLQRSNSNLCKTSSITPVALQRSRSFLWKKTTPTEAPKYLGQRPNSMTPQCASGSASRSRTKSPYKISAIQINNKLWVAKQFHKVLTFLKEKVECSEEITKELKPPSLRSFVEVMEILFDYFYSNVVLNTTNYREVVMIKLKMWGYPGPLTPSLLKTVNTMHSWPQVVSIFGWLVDCINFIYYSPREESLITIVKSYVTTRYKSFNNYEEKNIDAVDREFEQKLVEYYGIDIAETNNLRKKMVTLTDNKNQLEIKWQAKQAKVKQKDELREELRNKIMEFNRGPNEDEAIDEEIANLEAELEDLDVMLEKDQREISEVEELLAQQKHSINEKEQLESDIKHSEQQYEDKNEELKNQERMRDEFDLEFTKLNKKIAVEVGRINNDVFKLVLFDNKFKVLQLPSDRYCDEEFAKNKTSEFFENKKMLENEMSEKLEKLKETEIEQMTVFARKNEEERQLKAEEIRLKLIAKNLNTKCKKDEETLEELINKEEETKKNDLIEIENLKNAIPDNEPKQQLLDETKILYFARRKKLEDFKVSVAEYLQSYITLKRENYDLNVEIHNLSVECMNDAMAKRYDQLKKLLKGFDTLDEIKK